MKKNVTFGKSSKYWKIVEKTILFVIKVKLKKKIISIPGFVRYVMILSRKFAKGLELSRNTNKRKKKNMFILINKNNKMIICLGTEDSKYNNH